MNEAFSIEAHNKNDVFDGLLIIDKPADLTSAAVVRRIKRLTGVNKVGHTGTLDPFATGVMICPVNQATRLAQFFLNGCKTYRATLRLGIETDTQDLTGTPTAEHPVGDIPSELIERVFDQFKGTIDQVPPVYSALKHKGIPLYKYARAGKPIRKAARQVHISLLSIRSVRLPEIDFEVECSSGTYIRTLGADIGAALGCGGHISALERISSCGFTSAQTVSLDRLEDLARAGRLAEVVVPMAEALRDMPSHVADPALQEKIRYGRPLTGEDFPPPNGVESRPNIKVTDAENRLLTIIHIPENKNEYRYCCVFHFP